MGDPLVGLTCGVLIYGSMFCTSGPGTSFRASLVLSFPYQQQPRPGTTTKKGPRSFTRRPFSHFQAAAKRQRIEPAGSPNRAHLALGGLRLLPSYFFFFFLAAFLVAIVGYLSFHWLPSGPNFNSRLREPNSELPLSLLPSWQLSSGRSLPLCSPITAPSPRRKQDHRRRCGISSSGSILAPGCSASYNDRLCLQNLRRTLIHKTSARHSRFPSPLGSTATALSTPSTCHRSWLRIAAAFHTVTESESEEQTINQEFRQLPISAAGLAPRNYRRLASCGAATNHNRCLRHK